MSRRIGWLILCLTALIASLALVIRFIVFPNLGWVESQAEALLARAVEQPVSMTGLRGRFEGMRPVIQKRSLTLSFPRFADQPGSGQLDVALSRPGQSSSNESGAWRGRADLTVASFDLPLLSALSRSQLCADDGSFNLQASLTVAISAAASAMFKVELKDAVIARNEKASLLAIRSASGSFMASRQASGGVRLVLQQASVVEQDGGELTLGDSDPFCYLIRT